jgi:hypothetical protein
LKRWRAQNNAQNEFKKGLQRRAEEARKKLERELEMRRNR